MSTSSSIIRVGAGVVIMRDGKTLLAKRRGSHGAGSWGSMGGHVEFGETPIEAIQREAREELGIELTNIRFASCASFAREGKQYVDVSFVADLASGEPMIREHDRVEALEWFSLDALPSPLFEPVAMVLQAITEGTTYTEVRDGVRTYPLAA